VRAILGALIDFGRDNVGKLPGSFKRVAKQLLDRQSWLHARGEAVLPARPGEDRV
jgi:hypothetical protein